MNELFSDLFIFELANNHQGSAEHALRIIQAMGVVARKHGIRAGVKFQYRDLDTFIHPAFRDRPDVPHVPRFLSTRLTDENFRRLVAAVRYEGLIAICTPFDEVSVKRAVDHGVQILKVASCSADDWPLLEAVASAKQPVIASTGGLSLRDIDSLSRFFSRQALDYALLHCVAVYPSPAPLLNLGFISRMIRRYPHVPIGYSGHEDPDDTSVVQVAVSRGARILERHVGIATDTTPLNRYSLGPAQVDAWVRAALAAREMCGSESTRTPNPVELESLRSLKRGVYARKNIASGAAISRDDVTFAMPCAEAQTTSGEWGRYRTNFIASRDYATGDPIVERRAPDVISFTRDIIREAQGMLHEASIAVGDDVEVELSHHFGLSQFRTTGAIFITIVNRDYCKKLAVLLPGQSHPGHHHKIKEETFHLLWGDLEVGLNHRQIPMTPGDKMLVRPGVNHSFTTRGGAICEEVSTKNIKSDSYYDDERIQRMDPIERKTILETW